MAGTWRSPLTLPLLLVLSTGFDYFPAADGNPATTRTVNKEGLRRNGVSDETQNALKQAFKLLIREKLTIPNALERIEADIPTSPEIQHLIQFVRTSQRGIGK